MSISFSSLVLVRGRLGVCFLRRQHLSDKRCDQIVQPLLGSADRFDESQAGVRERVRAGAAHDLRPRHFADDLDRRSPATGTATASASSAS